MSTRDLLEVADDLLTAFEKLHEIAAAIQQKPCNAAPGISGHRPGVDGVQIVVREEPGGGTGVDQIKDGISQAVPSPR